MAFKEKQWFHKFTTPKEDLTGQKFNKWSVVNYAGNRGGIHYWNCKCECGQEKSVKVHSLLNGKSKSCGCLRAEVLESRSKKEVIITKGSTFGRLTIINPRIRINGILHCEVICLCGKGLFVLRHNILSGNTLSCGCLHSEISKDLVNKINNG